MVTEQRQTLPKQHILFHEMKRDTAETAAVAAESLII